jgi:hypothetical protein
MQQLCGMLEQALGALQAVRLTSYTKRQRV